MRRFRAWVAALLVAVFCCLPGPLARGQSSAAEQTPAAESEDRPAVAQHALAFLSAALVLVIVCAPTRKG